MKFYFQDKKIIYLFVQTLIAVVPAISTAASPAWANLFTQAAKNGNNLF